MEAHRESFGLTVTSTVQNCTEDFIPKYEISESESVFPGGYLIVGDRFQDIEVAEHHPSAQWLPLRLRLPRGTGIGGCMIDDIRYELNDLF